MPPVASQLGRVSVATNPILVTGGTLYAIQVLGDKADFGKFGLFRRISGLTDPNTLESDLTLAVVWYLNPDECCRGDGGIVGFLQDTPSNRRDFRACDPDLWDALRKLVDEGKRCVHEIPKIGILPENTKSYDLPLHFPPFLLRPARKETHRLWLVGALQATRHADIIYLDPDNGLAQDESKMYRKLGQKYAYTSDIREFWDCGKSVVIYHHLGHSDVDEHIRRRVEQLRGIPGVNL